MNAMTEAEAGTRWCHRMPSDSSNCIGSRCMAWRWAERMKDDPRQYMMFPSPPIVMEPVTDADGNRMGYCGLAG